MVAQEPEISDYRSSHGGCCQGPAGLSRRQKQFELASLARYP